MTTILGFRSGGVSYLAADSRICSSDPMPAKVQKIAERGPWALGVSGTGALVNLVHDAEGEPGESPADLVTWLRRAISAAGWKPADGAGPCDFGPWAIVAASRDGIYDVCSNLSYCRIDDGEAWSRGSGMEYARGAMAAFLSGGMDPALAIRETFKIVARFDPGTDSMVALVAYGIRAMPTEKKIDRRDFGISDDGLLEGTTLPVCATARRATTGT